MRSKLEQALISIVQDKIHNEEIEYDNDGQKLILDSIELGDFYITLWGHDKAEYENAPDSVEGGKDLDGIDIVEVNLDMIDDASNTLYVLLDILNSPYA